MNTHPMTPTPDSWHEMPVTSFPALVQFQDGECRIYSRFYGDATKVVRWRPWVNPELPRPDAFSQWLVSEGYTPPHNYAGSFASCWEAATARATAAERSRFAEGVEELLSYLRPGMMTSISKIENDLRALAKGDK